MQRDRSSAVVEDDAIDRVIGGIDRALRTVSGVARARRSNPADGISDVDLDEETRRHVGALMRVNHVGEVCAQALYQGQELTARSAKSRDALARAAAEEQDHLAWCAERLEELGDRPSLLNPVWYAGSFAIGALAGALGDRWNLAFVAETERQVEAHLSNHLTQVPAEDRRTRAVIEQMRADEVRHGSTARQLGAAEMPAPARAAMRGLSRIMTSLAYRL